MVRYIIAHDLGTSGDKATLFSTAGEMLATSVYAYDAHFFAGNCAEQDPADWWCAVTTTTRELAATVDAKDVLAISFSAHMQGCLPIDENGVPLRPHMLWADTRSMREAEDVAARIDADTYYHITGQRVSSSYTMTKILWLRNNEPEIYKKAAKFLQVKDYLVYRLTGVVLTDYTDASGTNLFDLNEFRWSKRILDVSGIDPAKLPEAVPSTTVAGTLTAEAARECGLTTATRVVMGGGDGMVATVGAGSVREGQAYACIGTSAWVGTTANEMIFDKSRSLFNWAHPVPGRYISLNPMQAAGASFSWMKNNICLQECAVAQAEGGSPYDRINAEIASAPVGSNGLMFLPHLMGERSPRWNPRAKGCFIGLKMDNTRADMLRSVIEGIGYNLRIIMDRMTESGAVIGDLSLVGGMAKGEIERQIFASIWNRRLHLLNYLEEAGSIGAAIIAGVGIGEFESFDVVSRFIRRVGTIEPDAGAAQLYERYVPVFDRAYNALCPTFEELHALTN